MVQIIPKQEEDRPLWVDILFFLSLGSVVLCVGAFFFLQSAQGSAREKVAVLDASLAKERNADFLSLEAETKGLKRKVQDFTTLFQERENPLVPLAVLESATHPKTFFKTLSLDLETNSMEMEGRAETFRAVEEQLAIFRTIKGVTSVELSNLGFSSEGDISYQVRISFSQELFSSEL
ncbi:MAG: hypothetical protein Q7S63_00465 [bacterium]|nr:hypothetical protein [bacterium]